ncbi:RNA methyltransferase [Leptospira wolffii]|uniref:TrmH family RNA methyltransferase n=1 Tax=Leptospira wolffii TaxID=409998 RepID=UPI001083FD63|nr:RNA methyltransferase [Leptospira wolffii]TGL46638.1 RNA methyltransferase [Leptospira wolffii]
MYMPFLKITKKNAEFQIIQALKENRVKRSQSHEIFVEGIEVIKQLIRTDRKITRIIVKDRENISNWAKDLIESHKNAKIIEMAPELYNELCDKSEPSELVVTAFHSSLALEDLVLPANPFYVLFDRPSDTGNFGSFLRSADAFRVDAIFVMGHGIDIYEPKVLRSSLGSVFHHKIVSLESFEILQRFLSEEKSRISLRVIGTDSKGSVSLSETKLQRPICMILGNEAKGMSVKLQSLCDEIVSIPLDGNVNSLNVASAASIFMWDVFRNSRT